MSTASPGLLLPAQPHCRHLHSDRQGPAPAHPGEPSIASAVEGYKGRAVASAGEAFDPTPANLDARTRHEAVGGIKAALLPKKNRGQTVSLVLTLHYGNEESLHGQAVAAGMPGMLMAGTKKHDRQALRDAMDNLGVRIFPGAGGFGFGRGRRGGGGGRGGAAGQLTFSVQAKHSNLPAAIKLLGEILREPAFPADQFEATKRRSLAMAERMRTEPSMLASNRLSRALSPYPPDDVRYVPTASENMQRLKAVTLPQVVELYRTQLGTPKASWPSSATSIQWRHRAGSAKFSTTGSPRCQSTA